MNIINKIVNSKAFGKGIVLEQDDNYIIVKFDTKTSKFLYPDAFQKFISLDDADIQQLVLNEIELLDAKKQQEKENKQREQELKNSTETNTIKSATLDEKFGDDYNVNYLARNPILTYQQVEDQFGIKIAGFGRGINKTDNTIVLISSIDKKKSGFVYHDRWTSDGDYLYSGEGKNGDQQLKGGNLAIYNAGEDNKSIHLFVKFSPKEYYYQGVFVLVETLTEEEKDESNNLRKEYKFRLRKVD